jgi:Na+/proline symporter
MIAILMIILVLLGVIGWIYEIRNETEEDRIKKKWLFEHGLY